MTKRTKLLSLMVAMVMCFACGIMMMTSSAKAAVEVPTVAESDMKTDLDWSTGKNFNHVGICVDAGLATDWFVFEYHVPAGVTNENETTITFGLVTEGNYAKYERIDIAGGKVETDGEFARAAFDIAADSGYIANASDKDVKVRMAMDLANGKVYGSIADAEFEEIASFENFAYVSSAETLIPYVIFGGNPSIKRLNNVKLYSEEGVISSYRANNPGNVHHGAPSFNADKTTSLNITAVKPTGNEVSFVLTGSLDLVNEKPTTSDWIIYEYVIAAGNTYSNAQNGLCTALSNNGWVGALNSSNSAEKSVYLHAFANPIPPQTIGSNLFAATEDTPVKLAVNTVTGLFAYYRDGAWKTFAGAYAAAGISGTDRYYSLKSNGAQFNGMIKDVVCYDANGVDLGVKSTLVKVADPNLPATAVKPEVDNRYYANDGIKIQSATATTADHIILEYTLKAGMGPTGSVPQNGMISTLSTDGTVTNVSTAGSVSGYLYQYGSPITVHTAYDWFTAGDADTTVKMVINTKTGSIFVAKNGGPYAEYAIHTDASAFTAEERFFGITTNALSGYAITGWVEDLVCYDSNGVNLGVKTGTSFSNVVEGKVVDILENLGCNNVGGGRYIGNIYFKDLEGNDIEGFCLGTFTAKSKGVKERTLKFVAASATERAFQLFSPQENDFAEGNSVEDWQWEEVFNNEWFVVEAGTILGGKVQLAEDVIIRMHGSAMQIFNASSVSFNITYENVGEAENPNATSYSYASSVTLADLEKENAIFGGWYIGDEKVEEVSVVDFYGDVTLTAKWQSIDLIKYNVEFVNGGAAVNFYATFENVDEEDISATIDSMEAEISFDEVRNAYAFNAPINLFTIADIEVEIEILLNDVKFASASVDVYAYLLAIANGEGELAAVAADVLALAAAQFDLYTEMFPEVGDVYEGIDVSEIEVSEVTLPEVGAGEIGLRDENNKWSDVTAEYSEGVMVISFTFTTTVEGTLTVEANGLTDEFEVVDGVVTFEIPLVVMLANAKLVFKVYDGETQIGNDLVVNIAGFISGLDVSDAVVNYLTRTVALYNTIAAYLAD